MLFTAAHELTHFIKEKSPENFEALERIVAEGFTKKGLSIDALTMSIGTRNRAAWHYFEAKSTIWQQIFGDNRKFA